MNKLQFGAKSLRVTDAFHFRVRPCPAVTDLFTMTVRNVQLVNSYFSVNYRRNRHRERRLQPQTVISACQTRETEGEREKHTKFTNH